MSEQSREQPEIDEPDGYGSLSMEDDPDGTENPADLAGSATPDDADVGYQPSASEADQV